MNTNSRTSVFVGLLIASVSISASLIFVGVQIGKLEHRGDAARLDSVARPSTAPGTVSRITPSPLDASKMQWDIANDYVYGSRDAPVSLISFMDFQCPFCAKFYPAAKQFVDESQGKINFVVRWMPLPIHDRADFLANLSRCVGEQQGHAGFYAFANIAFASPRALEDDELVKTRLVTPQHLDGDRLKQCSDTGKYATLIATSFAQAKAIGFNGTPSSALYSRTTNKSNLFVGAVSVQELGERLKNVE